MKKSIKRLQEYIDNDSIYQESKKGYEPSHNDGSGDFERFCIEHCGDIEKLLEEYKTLTKKFNDLQFALCAVREKWNRDKARYRRKAKKYRYVIRGFEDWITHLDGTFHAFGNSNETWVMASQMLEKIQQLKEENL